MEVTCKYCKKKLDNSHTILSLDTLTEEPYNICYVCYEKFECKQGDKII